MHLIKKLSAAATLALAATVSSCATPSNPSEETPAATPKREEILPLGSQSGVETVVLMGTNDIHGTLAPELLKTRDPQPIEYKAGGVATLASYVNTLRNEFGDHFLWLDAGDEFQGTIESNTQHGRPLVQFFNAEGLAGAAVGNHEFDYGPDTPESKDLLGALKGRMSEAHYPYLAANILDKDTGALYPFPNTVPSRIYSVGQLKIGVIGLSTLDTPKTTRAGNIVQLKFADLKDATLREAKKLRSEGANLILITAHVGLRCETGRVTAGWSVRKEADPQGECGHDDEMVQLLRSIPSGTVDAVVAGHSHQIVHHWIAGVPVIQGGAFGRYFNLIYLHYDLNAHKLLTDRTRIEGPVPVCPAVFKNQNDCNGDRPAPARGRGPLVSYQFHGKKIEPDSSVSELIRPALDQAEKARSVILGEAARSIEHVRTAESPLGDLVTDAVRDATHADVVVMNSGGIRAPLEQGKISYGGVFRVLPFDNALVTLKVTGQELQTILRVAESGSRGFSPISGVKLRLIGPEYDAPSSDLNGDGHIDPWETNRLKEVRLADGSLIQPHKTYTLATIDFLVTGGDDVGWALMRVPEARKTFTSLLVRDAVVNYIKKLSAHGAINSPEHPLLDPRNPRVVYVKEKEKGVKRRRRSKRRPAS